VLLELWRGRRQRWWRGGGTSWWLVVVGDCRVRRKIAGEEAFEYIYMFIDMVQRGRARTNLQRIYKDTQEISRLIVPFSLPSKAENTKRGVDVVVSRISRVFPPPTPCKGRASGWSPPLSLLVLQWGFLE